MSAQKYAFYDVVSGKISKTVITDAVQPDPDPAIAYAVAAGDVHPNTHYVSAVDGSGAVFSLRSPVDVSGLSLSGPAPHVLALTGLPSGAAVVVINAEGVRGDFDTSEDLTLSDAGTYALRVKPEFPDLPARLEVVVT